MKTSELLLKIKDLGFVYDDSEFNQIIRVYTSASQRNHEAVYLTISAHEFAVNQGYVVCSAEARDLVRCILDYLDTPLEEREEKKKYSLKSKLFEFGTERHLYLINSTLHKQYCLALNISQSFTQKEIDAMPFDTSFFIKEEV